jgi:transcriptional regulator with XRE-family HTH domain
MNEKDKELLKKLGINLRRIRKQKNISATELSDKTGICKIYIYKIESGKAYAVAIEKHIYRIACALGVKCSFIFENI